MPGPFNYTVNWRPDIGNMRVIYELTAWNQVGDAQDNVKNRVFYIPIEPELLAQSMTGQEFLAYMLELFFIRVPELSPDSN